ncbi:MAG TPA: type IV secretory system conjugative DNA transfer family protein [Solirubrobacteraceae bacterium]|nr:type IV secretory system conjugative DNA transfer family protein [Solirubrobacteraceae bacterium]
MSRMIGDDSSWGPSHQYMDPPFRRSHPFASCMGGLFTLVLLLCAGLFLRSAIGSGSGSVFAWTIGLVIAVVVLRVALTLGVGVLTRTPRTRALPVPRAPAATDGPVSRRPVSPAARVREGLLRVGSGAYLGENEYGEWVAADPESAVMILGPPRSGKTSAVMIPALMAASGAVVSTSTKPDVMRATMNARMEIGEVWLFDPSASEPVPEGARRLSWSPVSASSSWDEALIMARAMTAASRAGAGTTNESHWSERAAALLGPLLYAAHLTDRPIEDVLRWTLRQDLVPALEVLADAETQIAADVLVGIERTDARERSSIFSATAGVLSAYNSDSARQTAASPNFDPIRFAASTDTLYITSSEHRQAVFAPLIVGLLEQIRHAVYEYARNHPLGLGMLWLLDEVANIAPIHDLPALVSQAGGQNLQVVIGLQDLSQARTRWGTDATDGFLSLFQAKLILNGIADTRTLEAVSLALGEYDRDVTSQALGHSQLQEWFTHPTHSDTVSYQTQRQRVLTPGEIARLPDGHGLLLRGTDRELLRLTRWYESEPWRTVGADTAG